MLPVRPNTTTFAALAMAAAAAFSPLSAAAAVSSAEAQRAVLLDCKDDLGYRGDARLIQTRTSSGAIRVRMGAYDLMNEADAALVNACADRRAGIFVPDGGRPLIASHPTCPRHDPILYLGSAYCFKGR